MKIYVCKPFFKHFWDIPKSQDLKHFIHYITLGVILIDHKEPDGRMASNHHKGFIILCIFK